MKEESQGNTHALFISRENIEESGRFKVGFSVNQVNHFSSGSSVLPFAYAKQFINKIVVGHEVLKSGVVKGGPTDMNIARIIGNNSGTKTIVHYITIGMDDKDVVYVISFEAKESEWDALYGVGGAMLNYIVLGS